MAGDLIDIATARERVLEHVRRLGAEEVALADALGRVLAEDVSAEEDLPPFDSSAMDGYAVIAGPAAELDVVDESRAGHPAQRSLAQGQAIAISTGALIPEGADAVVPVERVQTSNGRVSVPETAAGANLRHAGDDVRRGEAVLRAGSVLGPAELAVAAALGHSELPVGRRPQVVVLATGDELVPPGEPLGAGQIRNSNTIGLAAQARQAGAEVVGNEIVRDNLESTKAALSAALERADVVCVSGGVSVGPHDHVKPALAELGVREVFWRVALKPGKPTWFGARDGKLVFGLPGNPVSAMVTFHLFARPALRALAGAQPDDTSGSAVLDEPLPRNAGRDEVVRCRLRAAEDGWHVAPTRDDQSSHVLTSMLAAEAFAIVRAGEGTVAAGERVPIELIR
ncbi:MAG TPA: gephyrin-like molybdotransferase Glp [Thermoleophilaceae bacterium]|nr:gephyrin-like molybdotransferase Glp [Thermoleophilaceae bacterium]